MPSNRTIVGVAVLLFGAVLFGVGLHHLIATGTCSSTGYSSDLGPVPRCPKGTGWWMLFLFAGVFMAVIGGLVSGGSSVLLIIPTVFSAIGVGALTVAFDKNVASGSKTFGLIFGGVFALMGLIPALVIAVGALRKLGRGGRASPTGLRAGAPPSSSSLGSAAAVNAFGGATSQPDAILGAYAAAPTAPTAPSAPTATSPSLTTPAPLAPPVAPAAPRSAAQDDVLEKIAKLAELHKSGALTDEEFAREKSKLLAEL
jgi:hypothetical protein